MTAPTLFDLSGRTALVTGASSGLGRHFAKRLAASGARVAVAARRTEALEELQAEIEAFDGRALPIRLDVQDEVSVKQAVDQVHTELGCIDLLINNAGVVSRQEELTTDLEEWDRVVRTNLTGAWLMARSVAAHLIAAEKSGSIINISSVLGQVANGQVGVESYCASKAGLINLTRSLALQWADYGIRVNAICPGFFVTDMTRSFLESEAGARLKQQIPQTRFGEYGDLDGPLLLLSSELASGFMTGSVLTVDGGHTAALPTG